MIACQPTSTATLGFFLALLVIGLLSLFATAYVAYTGNIYSGLWYPVIFALMTAVIGFLFLKETKDVDIAKPDPKSD